MVNTNTNQFNRRNVMRLATAGAMLLGHPLLALARSERGQVEVWKTAECGCCRDWIHQLQKSGFKVVVTDVPDTGPIRSKLGLPEKFGSCHTARLSSYVIEGHVPARELLRVQREKPRARGLAVPGMPVGSPGMNGPIYGGRKDAYDVLLVFEDGSSRIYQSYPSKSSTHS